MQGCLDEMNQPLRCILWHRRTFEVGSVSPTVALHCMRADLDLAAPGDADAGEKEDIESTLDQPEQEEDDLLPSTR